MDTKFKKRLCHPELDSGSIDSGSESGPPAGGDKTIVIYGR